MKKVFAILALVAFVAVGTVAMAAGKAVNCCVDGKIQKVTKAECTKLKGKVVKNAKSCKPMKK